MDAMGIQPNPCIRIKGRIHLCIQSNLRIHRERRSFSPSLHLPPQPDISQKKLAAHVNNTKKNETLLF